MLNTLDMHKELESLKRRYAIALVELKDRAEKATTNALSTRPGAFSSHDAFNIGASASELATLAGKIEQTENVIRWMADKAEV